MAACCETEAATGPRVHRRRIIVDLFILQARSLVLFPPSFSLSVGLLCISSSVSRPSGLTSRWIDRGRYASPQHDATAFITDRHNAASGSVVAVVVIVVAIVLPPPVEEATRMRLFVHIIRRVWALLKIARINPFDPLTRTFGNGTHRGEREQLLSLNNKRSLLMQYTHVQRGRTLPLYSSIYRRKRNEKDDRTCGKLRLVHG